MTTPFTAILNGQSPCYKILEDEKFLAFLNIRPIKEGHALVIPKGEIDYIFDMDDSLLAEMMIFAKKVAKKLEEKIECEKIGVVVAGLEVRHVHVHLIPIRAVSELNFANSRPASPQELGKVLKKILGA